MTHSTPLPVALFGSAREGLRKKVRSECTRNIDEFSPDDPAEPRGVEAWPESLRAPGKLDVSSRIEFNAALHWQVCSH